MTLKEQILSFSKFEHVDFLELYNLKNTDLESEIIEKVAYAFKKIRAEISVRIVCYRSGVTKIAQSAIGIL